MLDTILPSATPKTPKAVYELLWKELIPLLAGRPRVRVSRDNGRNYRQRDECDLPRSLPSRPAAVMLHNIKTGLAKVLAIDFDTKSLGPERVALDVRRTQELLASHSLRWIHDHSPSGGHHLYVPVAGGISPAEAYDTLFLLARMCPTVDPLPHRTAQQGCIRMPGSAHKRGGHQELLMSPGMALKVAREPGTAQAFGEFRASLEHLRPPESDLAEQDFVVPDRSGASKMSARILDIARNGFVQSDRYQSPSEARFAVLRTATNLGMGTTEIYQRMNDGRWPGLGSLFAGYKHPMKALKGDLQRLQTKGHRQGHVDVVKNNTSKPTAQGGSRESHSISFHEALKVWRNAVHLREKTYGSTRAGLQIRLLLRALGEAASKAQSSSIEFGCRALALATGMDHSTVSRHLRRLRSESDPLIRHTSPAHGKYADTYELVIPESVIESAAAVSYRRGKLYALRPVFRVLGTVAAFTHEALEQGCSSTAEVMQATGLSRSAVQDALSVLAEHHMAFKGPEGWVETGANLTFLAELLGATDDIELQRHAYSQQRFQWLIWLSTRMGFSHGFEYTDQDYPFEEFEPPPEITPPPVSPPG